MAGPTRTSNTTGAAISTGTATTGAVVGTNEADVTVTLSPAQADTDYSVTASVVINEAGESLRIRRVRSKTATQVVVNVVNNAITSKTGTVNVIAVHN